MRLDFRDERVLAVVAHPDDAELLCAGTLARAKADGAEIAICVLCRGDKGQTAPPTANLSDVRREEMREAAALLGAELLEGGFGDGELFEDLATRRALIELLRRFRPTLVLAHWAGDYHPDHQAAAALAEAASWLCASAGHETASAALPAPPVLWHMDTVGMAGFEPAFYVNVSEFLDLKRSMLRCHRSQLARGAEANFAPLEPLMLAQCQARGTQAGVAAAEAFRPRLTWKRVRAW